MRIALAQINSTVGDLAGNVRRIVDFIARAKAAGAQLVVFPELAILGYPPKDLLLKPQFIDDNLRALKAVTARVSGIDAMVGYAEKNEEPVGRPLRNAVALLREGKVVSRHFKTLLPTYDVFDEGRYFEPARPGEQANIVSIANRRVGISICEDLWNDEKMIPHRLYHQNPIADLFTGGAEVMVNTSASPFVVGKHDFRLKLFSSQVKQFGKPLVYVNQVGGNDELVFDGNSVVLDADGSVLAQAKDFAEDLLIVDLPAARANSGEPVRTATSAQVQQVAEQTLGAKADQSSPAAIESIYKALVLGLRDYVGKCGFKSVVLGLSGGIDSALTAALAVAAFGKEKVVGIAMPSRFSSDHSVTDAKILAENLGIEFQIIPIQPAHQAYEKMLAPAFAGRAEDVAEENLQARIRGAILMAFSNKFNHLLLTTGNKSELAVGYCTLYGDMCGGLAVISDVPKTIVYKVSEFINQQAGRELIPRNTITKPPSAELRPNQTDQDSLPPYEILDAILHRYVEEEKGVCEIIADGYEPATVMRVVKLIDRSEYKRRQAAPGLKVTSRAFGFGRRMPIAQGYDQTPPKHGEPAPQEA
ncbi:MAG TPA: NAD+ synthase [Tepidisphaeraceae bacterium]|jgi:NAD+ synthetase|nr:NAD+ synthase [Tepidisphaeraceae bacterium]